jgi:NADPH2:quinone reductase
MRRPPTFRESRIGERVWIFGAQSNRPFGTVAQLTVVSELRHPTTRFSLPAAAGQSN